MESRLEKGLIQVYTGSGKGKSTAALGLALRSAGQGLNVRIIQFMKAGPFGEHRALESIDGISISSWGREAFVFPYQVEKEDKFLAAQALAAAKDALEGAWDIVILDEINTACHFNLIEVKDILDLCRNKPDCVELVLTGDNAHEEVLETADLITEMKDIRHPFSSGLGPRRGIEY